MHVPLIRTDPVDVDIRLRQFGLNRTSFFPLLHAVSAARADTVGADAATASGTKAWLAGVRHVNLMMLSRGWVQGRNDGVEEIRDPSTGIAFVYQNVDQACSPIRGPRAISGKGPAADRMIEEGQGWLFEDGAPEAVAAARWVNDTVWFVCVSAQDDQVCAELSLPLSLENNNFKLFAERIFIVQPGEWTDVDLEGVDDGDDYTAVDYEFKMSKK